jgi:hypothetical protein
MRADVVRAALAGATLVAFLAPVDNVVATVPDDPPPPMLPAADMAELGWTLLQCGAEDGSDMCSYEGGDGVSIGVLMRSLRPFDDAGEMVDTIAKLACASGTLLDVGGRADTLGCNVEVPGLPTQTDVVFANDSWQFTIIRLADSPPSPDEVGALLALRDQQLEAAGGERTTTRPDPEDASRLDRFLPDEVPSGLFPPGGVTSDRQSLGTVSEGEIELPPSTYDFLERRTVTRARFWVHNGGYGLAVVVNEYPYEVLAGLALGTFEGSSYAPIDTPAGGLIENLLAVDASAISEGDSRFVIEAFRRGRYQFMVVASGPDVASTEALASEVVLRVAELAPTNGATAPVQPPSTVLSILQAALVTGAFVLGAMLLRRLVGGRARRSPPLQQPQPQVDDVNAAAAALRRDGRTLALFQVFACAIIVVALVADIGWWWPVLVAVGLAIGVLATTWARRREQGRSVRSWSLHSLPAWLFGSTGAVFLVVGVALAVRALKEAVLLPSLTHLRLAERFTTTPLRLSVFFALTGLGLLVIGAILLRRGRAHARSARGRVMSGHGDAILYLRSFHDDELSVPSVHSARRPFFELFGLRGKDPFEEGVAWELASHGALTAVGRPGSSTVSLGAARDLLTDDVWQATVIARMDTARYVVVAVGSTQGLAWELNALMSRGHLGKCIFLVPPGSTTEIESRWIATRAAVDEAAGRSFVEPVAIVGTLTVNVDATSGSVSATRADRADEAGYRAAIEHALGALVGSNPVPQSGFPAPSGVPIR